MDSISILIAVCLLNAAFLIALAVLQLRNFNYIIKIEVATNSMKDALVSGAVREGVTEGRRQVNAREPAKPKVK